MLKKLQLKNFRGFANHTVNVPASAVLVGANNAGKSTIVEAFRILSLAQRRSITVPFSDPPPWTDLPLRSRGFGFKPVGLDVETSNVFHRYSDPPSAITIYFESKQSLTVMIGANGDLFATLTNRNGEPVPNRAQAREQHYSTIAILPQIGPISKEEKVLTDRYVHAFAGTPLTSLHFRNQLNLAPAATFSLFEKLAITTWDGLRYVKFDQRSTFPGDALTLMIGERGFSAEVGWMGHGLQMWLQTMWFLANSAATDTVILDEPDVYMHADLQRKLVRLIRQRHQQLVVATHSVEIMSEVDPGEIVIIDRSRNVSSAADSLPAVQRVIDGFGGVHNIHLARLWRSKRCILVEGDDLKLLKLFQNILFPSSPSPLDSLPSTSIGGWGGWDYAIGSKMVLHNAAGEDIRVYCILDSDYYSDGQIANRYAEAEVKGVCLHIWKFKELENYFIVPDAIARSIIARTKICDNLPTVQMIIERIEAICETLREETSDKIAQQVIQENVRSGFAHANPEARRRVLLAWKSFAGKVAIVSGKSMLSQLSEWSQNEWKVSLSPASIARYLNRENLYSEVRAVLEAIETAAPFSHPTVPPKVTSDEHG